MLLVQAKRRVCLAQGPDVHGGVCWVRSAVSWPAPHLPRDRGVQDYGMSIPLGSFAHGKRAFPQQVVTCVAASSSVTTTGLLMECGSEGCVTGSWEQLRLNLESRLHPSKSLGLEQRLRTGKTVLVIRKSTERKNGQKTLCPFAPRLSFRRSWSFLCWCVGMYLSAIPPARL